MWAPSHAVRKPSRRKCGEDAQKGIEGVQFDRLSSTTDCLTAGPGPVQAAALVLFSICLIAGPKGRSASQYSFHGLIFRSNAGAVRSVNRVGSSPAFTLPQLSGMDTVAPSRARVESGATAVAVRSLRK